MVGIGAGLGAGLATQPPTQSPLWLGVGVGLGACPRWGWLAQPPATSVAHPKGVFMGVTCPPNGPLGRRSGPLGGVYPRHKPHYKPHPKKPHHAVCSRLPVWRGVSVGITQGNNPKVMHLQLPYGAKVYFFNFLYNKTFVTTYYLTTPCLHW